MSKYDGMAIAGLVAVVVVVAVLNGNAASLKTGSPEAGAGATSNQNNEVFHKRLLEIAEGYESYGRVEESYRIAPTLCGAPRAMLRWSNTGGDQPHGKKLYHLYAKDSDSYIDGKRSKLGQVIVKESWVPDPLPAGSPLLKGIQWNKKELESSAIPIGIGENLVGHDGKFYQAGKQSSLFIMYKMARGTPGTDQGWVYGTVTADGKEVTSAGRVDSCISCHQDAPKGRLFGLAASN